MDPGNQREFLLENCTSKISICTIKQMIEDTEQKRKALNTQAHPKQNKQNNNKASRVPGLEGD
jgi:hypothetical protein